MEPIPLIPRSKKEENHDTSSVIRDVFQDILGDAIFPENVAENIKTYNVASKSVKLSAKNAASVYEKSKLSIEDFERVEGTMMCYQGEYLISQNNIDNSVLLTEHTKLKRLQIFRDLDDNDIQKYSLIEPINLLPNRSQQSMDFRINSNRHRCDPCNDLDLYPSKLEKICTDEIKRSYKWKEAERPVIFTIIPQLLVFENYELNTTYQKTFKLRNITNTTQSFVPQNIPKKSFFSFNMTSESTRIAPGMCASFVVKYKTDVYQDVRETLTFKTYTGADVAVKLISYREAPSLTGFVFKDLATILEKSPQSEGFSDERFAALNGTIDCGNCLLGDHLELSLILKNEGGIGQFFIMTEEDWFFSDVQDVNKEMELTSDAFQIYPTYFEIETDEYVEIDINFFPVQYGLHMEKLFMLCNNNTLEEIDIIGDGLLFSTSFIDIEAHLKTPCWELEDSNSHFRVDFKNCLPYSEHDDFFTIHNNSFIPLQYRWEIRESYNSYENTPLKKLDPDWLKLKRGVILPPNSSTDFHVFLKPTTMKYGLYSIVLILFIENVPEISLAENQKFFVQDAQKTSQSDITDPKYLDIVAGEIEILCEVVPLQIVIDPEEVDFPLPLEYEQIIEYEINISTHGSVNLECNWEILDKHNGKICCVNIEPMEFTVEAANNFTSILKIKAHNYENIRETIRLYVNKTLYKKDIYITATVIKPSLVFSTESINFGFIRKGIDQIQNLSIINLGKEPIHWQIFEYYFDLENQKIHPAPNLDLRMSTTKGVLQCEGSTCETSYYVDASENKQWFSFLCLLASNSTEKAIKSLCLLTYVVTHPKVTINTKLDVPILVPEKLLYLGETTKYMICLHNTESLVGSFIFGRPIGEHSHNLTIKLRPKCGFIKAMGCTHVEVFITPHAVGVFDQIIIPCCVGRMAEPLFLTIMCSVDNICVNIYLPRKGYEYEKIFWPPSMMYDFEKYGIDFGEEEENKMFDSKEDQVQYKYPVDYSGSCTESETFVKSTIMQNDPCEDDILTLYKVEQSEVTSDLSIRQPALFNMNDSTELSENVSSFYSDIKSSSIVSLRKQLGKNVVVHKHVVEYIKVPIKTPVKKTIRIENLTPIDADVILESINFYAQEPEHQRGFVENILVNMKFKKLNEWEEITSMKYGIVVKFDPPQSKLKAFETIEIDVWVYGNTWGTYVEEVMIEINDILPFFFSVLIEIQGLPVEFPIALNSLSNTPIVRFGSVPYMSDSYKRKLKVVNITCIPINIVWYIFVNQDLDEELLDENLNFSLSTGILCANNSEKVEYDKITLEKRMFQTIGQVNQKIFDITPHEQIIPPKSSVIIEITFDSTQFETQFSKTEVEAKLIGRIYLTEELATQQNLFYRPIGTAMTHANVTLKASVEMPLLDLDFIRGDAKIKAYATNIEAVQETTYQLCLVFKNRNSAPAVVQMHTADPFEIVSLKTVKMEMKDSLSSAVIVQPGECVEVKINCVVDSETIALLAAMLYVPKFDKITEKVDSSTSSVTVVRFLNIHQKAVKLQITPLELTIYYPRLQVSPDAMDFGGVFVGNTKKMLLTLFNTTGAAVPFHVYTSNNFDELIVKPKFGILPPATGSTKTSAIISIYFIPTESREYQEVVKITTAIPYYSINVGVYAIGSHNEKFYVGGM